MNCLKNPLYDTLENLLERKYKLEKMKIQLINQIKEIDKEENLLCKKLWFTCDHKWIIDNSCSSDDLCKRYCKNCNLYNFKNLYFKNY